MQNVEWYLEKLPSSIFSGEMEYNFLLKKFFATGLYIANYYRIDEYGHYVYLAENGDWRDSPRETLESLDDWVDKNTKKIKHPEFDMWVLQTSYEEANEKHNSNN